MIDNTFTKDGLDVKNAALGITPKDETVHGIYGIIKLKGSISDDGTGTFAGTDSESLNIQVKFNDLDSAEVELPAINIPVEYSDPLDPFQIIKTMASILAGTYSMKLDF